MWPVAQSFANSQLPKKLRFQQFQQFEKQQHTINSLRTLFQKHRSIIFHKL